MNKTISIILFFTASLCCTIAQKKVNVKTRWNFENLKGLKKTDHSNGELHHQITLEKGGFLKFVTKKETKDRVKVQSIGKFTTGKYRWRVFIPKLEKNANVSVGAFIYSDDRHEIDFEITSGKEKDRIKHNAKDDEMLALLTTQANPFKSIYVPIKVGWRILTLDLSLVNGKYFVKWYVDGKLLSTVQQSFGDEISFYTISSLENLTFGDFWPKKDAYVIFDWMEYIPENK